MKERPNADEILQLWNIVMMLREYFKDDTQKIITWLRTENPLLGNVKPGWMMATGRMDKLQKFVMNQREGNGP
jgi:hypothetical protein